jgi:hypothetical protein
LAGTLQLHLILFVAAVLLLYCAVLCCAVVTTGVTDHTSVNVVIDPPHEVTVQVPDRYHLQLTLPVPISPYAEGVRFKRRTGKLAMLCTVVSTTQEPAAAAQEHEQLQDSALQPRMQQLSKVAAVEWIRCSQRG